MKIVSLAKDLDISLSDLREFLVEEDLGIDPQAEEISDKEAELIRNTLGTEDIKKEEINLPSEDTAEYYEEMEKQREERELRKQSRKSKTSSTKTTDNNKEKDSSSEKKQVGKVEIGDTITVKEFAEKTGIPVVKIIGDLMKNGVVATINQHIDYDTAALVASDLDIEISKKHITGGASDLLERNLNAILHEEDKSNLSPRPPIVTVMGHVDHGKTSVLDVIRKTHVASGEHGGITQHIGAYQAKCEDDSGNERLITFLDTPGHEAFTEMRSRGAQVTDVAVLVVAANEGVKPQTIESISHAKEAGVPIVVALNKMDLPDANPDRVKGELAEHGLQSEDWGGDVPMVPVSAFKKTGIDDLLTTILLVADVADLKANPSRPAVATVVEAHLDPSLGPVATVVVNAGTLEKGAIFVAGETFGRVKRMNDYNGKSVKEAVPSSPVFIAGFDQTPHSGDILQVANSEKEARRRASEIGELRSLRAKRESASSMGQIISAIQAGRLKELKIVLKADAKGSLEALLDSLADIKNDEVCIRIIHAGVGSISESDVSMAEASGAVLLGFHVSANSLAEEKAQQDGIEILTYNVIYKLLDDMKKLLSGLLEPEEIITELGEVEVIQVFLSKKKEMIIGGRVVRGKAGNHTKVRIRRDTELLGEGEVNSLQRDKDSVSEVQEGKECGMRVVTDIKIEPKDRLEFYKVEHKIRTF